MARYASNIGTDLKDFEVADVKQALDAIQTNANYETHLRELKAYYVFGRKHFGFLPGRSGYLESDMSKKMTAKKYDGSHNYTEQESELLIRRILQAGLELQTPIGIAIREWLNANVDWNGK